MASGERVAERIALEDVVAAAVRGVEIGMTIKPSMPGPDGPDDPEVPFWIRHHIVCGIVFMPTEVPASVRAGESPVGLAN
jgi:hypothetical protein